MVSPKQQIKKLENRIITNIRRALSRKELTELARLAIEQIRKRTRSGFGVPEARGNVVRLKSLSRAYVEYRKISKARGKLSSETTPGKSNLTFTGSLLDSLIVREVDVGKQKIFINANRKRRKGGVTNEQVAEFVAAQGRAFLNLSRNEVTKISRAYKNSLLNSVKRNFERT